MYQELREGGLLFVRYVLVRVDGGREWKKVEKGLGETFCWDGWSVVGNCEDRFIVSPLGRERERNIMLICLTFYFHRKRLVTV